MIEYWHAQIMMWTHECLEPMNPQITWITPISRKLITKFDDLFVQIKLSLNLLSNILGIIFINKKKLREEIPLKMINQISN